MMDKNADGRVTADELRLLTAEVHVTRDLTQIYTRKLGQSYITAVAVWYTECQCDVLNDDETDCDDVQEWLTVEQLVSEFDECLRPAGRSDYVTSVKTEL